MTGPGPSVGLAVTHRRYVPYSHAHYGGNLVDGAYVLGLFGDVATELCIRTDGDEGLLAGYDSVRMLAPVHGGDVIEVTATLTQVGRRSRGVDFEARVVCRSGGGGAGGGVGVGSGGSDQPASAAQVLDPPLVVTRAQATVVVP